MEKPGGGRRKGTSIRQWLVVSGSSGQSHLEEVEKHTIMKRTGLPARDLRVLDPQLSYPSTILGRERAIVVNLEHVHAVITATEVLVPNSNDPLLAPFLHDLHLKVRGAHNDQFPDPPLHQVREWSNMDMDTRSKIASCWPSFPSNHGVGKQGTENPQKPVASTDKVPEGNPVPAVNAHREAGTRVLPFELRALEVCLESACRCLETETLTLEKEAYPALDELTSKLSALNLERVRQLKSRLVALSGRVQKVRDELEHLLDDDMDMAEMYLSEKLARYPLDESFESAAVGNAEPEFGDNREEDDVSMKESAHESFGDVKPNIQELEMLLEAYFVQIDGTLNKLSHLREYVDDTEDYINIMLDDKQNQLLQMGVMLSTATIILTAAIVVVSLFGMNIGISLYDESTPYKVFWQTVWSTTGGCVGLYLFAIWMGKRSGLLQ